MKYILSFILILSNIFYSFAQSKFDYNWLYGYQNEVPSIDEGININFNDSPASVSSKSLLFDIYFSNAVMSDSNGGLLFYTNGCQVANQNHEIMMNGDSINPGEVHDFICPGYSAGSQSCLVLPKPNNSDKYYLFHKGIIFADGFPVYTNKLHFSLIDMSMNNGLGAVIEKNVVMIEDTLRAGEMTAIKHINGVDWWLISAFYNSNKYFSYLLRADTIEGPFNQSIGFEDSEEGEASGQVVFSPNGTKYARYNKDDQLYLYDFDRTNGQFSNFEHIMVDDTLGAGGCAISSNSRFLYVSTRNKLFQFDLQAADIEASKVLIDIYDGFADPLPTTFYQMQLAPDCRIFMNSTNTVDELHVIHNPNEKGLACNFEQRGFQLPSNHQFSMPHFPYYRMDTNHPICDSSLVVSSTQVYSSKQQKLRAYPNPATHSVTVDWSEALTENSELKIYNMIGQLIKTEQVGEGFTKTEISVADLPNGIYLLKVGQQKPVTLKVIN